MPVLFDSSARAAQSFAHTVASGSVSTNHTVNSLAPSPCAIVAVLLTGDVSQSGVTIGVTFGGTAMTPAPSGDQSWLSDEVQLLFFYLTNLDTLGLTGPQEVAASFSGMPTSGSATRWLLLASSTYSGVASVGTATGAGGSAATANSVTVASSALPAYAVVSAHAFSGLNLFYGYNQNKRVDVAGTFGLGPELLIGDAPGAASVTLTVNQVSTANWGALGVVLTPSVVNLSAAATVVTTDTAAISDHRAQPPSPLRYWLINGEPPDPSGGAPPPPIFTQDPLSLLDYTLDWTLWFAPTGDTVAGATFTPNDPAVKVFSVNTTAGTSTAWLYGGVPGARYSIDCHMVSAQGRQDDRTFQLLIQDT